MPGMNSCSPRCSASEITGTTAPPWVEPIAGAIGRGAESGRTTGLLSKHGSRMSWSGPGSAGGVTLVDVPAQAAGHDLPSNPAPMIPAPPYFNSCLRVVPSFGRMSSPSVVGSSGATLEKGETLLKEGDSLASRRGQCGHDKRQRDDKTSLVRECSGALLRARRLQFLARKDRKSTRLNSSHLVISYAVF